MVARNSPRRARRPSARTGRARREPGRPRLTQTQRVINAVKRGEQDARSIAKSARVPLLHVHPILSRLRREGRVEGFTGTLRVIEDAPFSA